jgi:uncharacterized damage-inducible protein DinB
LITADFVRTLIDYGVWARGRVLDAASNLSSASFVEPCGLDHGSIRSTLGHALVVEVLWRMRCGGEPQAWIEVEQISDLGELGRLWEESDGRMRAFAKGLTDEDLLRPVRYVTSSGASFEEQMWQLVYQMVNHSMQHRSEVALALTQMGQSPGNIDFILFSREQVTT